MKNSLIKINEKLNSSKYLNYYEKNSNSIFFDENKDSNDNNNKKNEFIFYSDFISSTTRPKGQISILDICSGMSLHYIITIQIYLKKKLILLILITELQHINKGKIDHLNIKHIGRLETKLHQLYIGIISNNNNNNNNTYYYNINNNTIIIIYIYNINRSKFHQFIFRFIF